MNQAIRVRDSAFFHLFDKLLTYAFKNVILKAITFGLAIKFRWLFSNIFIFFSMFII